MACLVLLRWYSATCEILLWKGMRLISSSRTSSGVASCLLVNLWKVSVRRGCEAKRKTVLSARNNCINYQY